MVFVDFLELDAGASQAAGVSVFAANGLFNPSITGGSEQPRGFDQVIALYDHYSVIGSRITANYVPAAASTIPVIVGIMLSDNVTISNIIGNNTEKRLSKWKFCPPTESRTVSLNFSARGFFNRGTPNASDTNRGTISANPLDEAFFHVYVASAGENENPAAVRICVKIEFLVHFTEPVNPPASVGP